MRGHLAVAGVFGLAGLVRQHSVETRDAAPQQQRQQSEDGDAPRDRDGRKWAARANGAPGGRGRGRDDRPGFGGCAGMPGVAHGDGGDGGGDARRRTRLLAGPGQRGPHLSGIGETLVRILGQGSFHGLGQGRGRGGHPFGQRRYRLLLVGHGHAHRVAAERRCSGQGLVQHHPQGVQVAAGGGRMPRGLLWRQIGRRPHDLARRGQSAGGALQPLGDAEVAELDPAVGRQEHVGRFDVAVNQAPTVGGGQRVEQPRAHHGGVSRCQRPEAREPVGEGLTLDGLHHDERTTLRVLAHVEHGDGVGVLERRRRTCLAQQARPGGLVGDVGLADQLDGDTALQAAVHRREHASHAARSEQLSQLVTVRQLRHASPSDPWFTPAAHPPDVSSASPRRRQHPSEAAQPSRHRVRTRDRV